MSTLPKNLAALCGLSLLATSSLHAADLPDPDGKPADMTKPVQVFLIMGQSNTLEMGKVTPNLGELYPFLVDDAGKPTVSQDVRNVSVMQKGDKANVYRDEWLSLTGKNKIGIETGIGHQLGHAIDAPVMLLKSSIGNRGLGWDLLPPGSESFEYTAMDKKAGKEVTWVYAGYKQSPNRWEKGTEPTPIGWYAGKQYDDDVANAKKVLADLEKHYPGAKGYEVAGFFWWQGEKDCGDAALAARYEKNLVTLIQALRKDFNAPKAKFVLGTLGEAEKGKVSGPAGDVFNAHMAVDGETGKYPEFKGSVSTVYTNPLSKGGSGNGHYNGNVETYTNVGLAMGEAMVKLLKEK
jgi:hypothetical protein